MSSIAPQPQSQPEVVSFSEKVYYSGNHGAIVIGKGGKTVLALKSEFNLTMLRAFKEREIDIGKPTPTSRILQYFIIKGEDERQVNLATIRVQSLLMSSMMRERESMERELDITRGELLEEGIRTQELEAEVCSTVRDLDITRGELRGCVWGEVCSTSVEKN